MEFYLYVVQRQHINVVNREKYKPLQNIEKEFLVFNYSEAKVLYGNQLYIHLMAV